MSLMIILKLLLEVIHFYCVNHLIFICNQQFFIGTVVLNEFSRKCPKSYRIKIKKFNSIYNLILACCSTYLQNTWYPCHCSHHVTKFVQKTIVLIIIINHKSPSLLNCYRATSKRVCIILMTFECIWIILLFYV